MKKTFRYYIIAWAVMLALFNVIAFVSPGWEDAPKYTQPFWTGYVLITIAFIGQLLCGIIAFRDGDRRRTFYKVSLVNVSYTGLIISFVFGGLCMLLPAVPYWVGYIVCAVVLALTTVSVTKTSAAADIVEGVDNKIKANTAFVKSVAADAQALVNRAKDEKIKAACVEIYDALRYSDPVSADTLAGIENEIQAKFALFAQAVDENNASAAASTAEELKALIADRNRKCRLYK